MLPAAVAGELRRNALPVEQWFELPEWEHCARPAASSDLGLCLVIGSGELAPAIADRIATLGGAAIHVTGDAGSPTGGRPTVDLTDADGYGRLLRRLAQQGRRPERIVLACATGATAAEGDRGLRHGLLPALALAQAIARAGDRGLLTLEILTVDAYAVDDADVADPSMTTTLGFTKVIPLELPHVRVRQIDLSTRDLADVVRTAVSIVDELAVPEPAEIVALRAETRWLPRLRAVSLAPTTSGRAWRRGGTYLITGGLGGLGAALAEHLARAVGARLALVGRTPLPPRSRWQDPLGDPRAQAAIAAVTRMEQAGGTVAVYAADVADADAMEVVRDDVLRRFGAIDGIVHAAGVSGGGLIEAVDRAALERVLSPKVDGTLVLTRVFGDLPLDLFMLCSTLASYVGGVGQVAYCAANAFLDSVPYSGLPLADRSLVVNWGGLLGAGMWIPLQGDVGMALDDAVDALERVVVAGVGPRVVIAPVRVHDALPWVPTRGPAGPDAGATAPAADRSTAELEQRLAALWARTLELDEVATDGDFFELGGNSALAIELLWLLADELGCRLTMQRLMEQPTPAGVARAVATSLGADSA